MALVKADPLFHMVIRKDYVCPFCDKAKAMLAEKGLGFSLEELTPEQLKKRGIKTVPHITYQAASAEITIGGSDRLAVFLRARGL